MASEVSDEEKTDENWLNDPEVQAEMNAWIDSRKTSEALDEKDAWMSEQERIATEPRIIDLTEPIPCIVSVKVTEDMIKNGTIPF